MRKTHLTARGSLFPRAPVIRSGRAVARFRQARSRRRPLPAAGPLAELVGDKRHDRREPQALVGRAAVGLARVLDGLFHLRLGCRDRRHREGKHRTLPAALPRQFRGALAKRFRVEGRGRRSRIVVRGRLVLARAGGRWGRAVWGGRPGAPRFRGAPGGSGSKRSIGGTIDNSSPVLVTDTNPPPSLPRPWSPPGPCPSSRPAGTSSSTPRRATVYASPRSSSRTAGFALRLAALLAGLEQALAQLRGVLGRRVEAGDVR